ncbi:MAG: hypothetical protein B6U89_05355 [Desulfurococcales archaeon ex4484_58]|nr:MAG: hypothetical protein B6U89_05355 [Desulfurococcales archaeon ex4484_58]
MAKALILHGGAGTWRYLKRREKAVETVKNCTSRAWRVLVEKNNALEAVVEAIRCMEDSGYLNAGWGSALDLFGERGLDAGIMASNGLLGAVGDVKATRNAILLARIVAEETPHILVVSGGADRLARDKNLPPLPPPPDHSLTIYREFIKQLVKGEAPRPYIVDTREFLEKNPVLQSFM